MAWCHACAWRALLVWPGPVLWLNVAHSLLRNHGFHDRLPPTHMALDFGGVLWGGGVGDLRSLLVPDPCVDEPTPTLQHVQHLTPPTIDVTIHVVRLGRIESPLQTDDPVRYVEVDLDVFEVVLVLEDVSEVERVPEETPSMRFVADGQTDFFLDGQRSAQVLASLVDAPRVAAAVRVDHESTHVLGLKRQFFQRGKMVLD
mmetsp:Transcript_11964/g.20202  ORF Transcript_11964/g.20202 Transcript_11964/m.20202 type:complete len:201 (+) Transcript_11964:445-1047(+)